MTALRCVSRAIVVALGIGMVAGVSAHHSYAMFDAARTATVTGTVAKLEWTNPHVFVWVYVPNPARDNGFDLYAFENGSPNVLLKRGWSKETFTVGEKLSIVYWPLADGRMGGHFAVATRVDGSVVRGAGGPGGGVDASDSVDAPAAPAAGKP